MSTIAEIWNYDDDKIEKIFEDYEYRTSEENYINRRLLLLHLMYDLLDEKNRRVYDNPKFTSYVKSSPTIEAALLKIELNKDLDTSDWSIIRKIGAGGFSSVFLGFNNLDPKQHIVIKRIEKKYPSKREINILQILSNNCSLYVLCYICNFESRNYNYLITEYLGFYTDLSNFNRIPVKGNEFKYYKIFTELLKGLRFIHENQIIHRDIKPQNIMINSELQIKYIDFGFSELADEISFSIKGTPAYLNPMLILMRRIDYTFENMKKSDLYSLECVFSFLLSGKTAFHCFSIDLVKKVIEDLDCDIPREYYSEIRSSLGSQLNLLKIFNNIIRSEQIKEIDDLYDRNLRLLNKINRVTGSQFSIEHYDVEKEINYWISD